MPVLLSGVPQVFLGSPADDRSGVVVGRWDAAGMRRRGALLNSSVAFALALLVTISWHELGHAAAGLGLGRSVTVYAFAVDVPAGARGQDLAVALAGPVLSLLTGLLVLAVYWARRPAGFTGLLVLWLGLLGVQDFAGYLITGLFFDGGDIGQALQLTGSRGWAGPLLFVLGWVLTYLNGRYATRELLARTSPAAPLGPQLRELGLFAWLLGTAIAVVLSAGAFDFGPLGFAVGVFEVLGTLSTGLFLIFVRLFMRVVPAHRGAPVWALPSAGAAALLAVAGARQLLLAPGLTL